MSRIGRNRHQLASPIWRASANDEVRAELDFHVDMLVREFRERGLSEYAARAEALRRFGDVARLTAQSLATARDRDMTIRRRDYLAELTHDLRYGVRQLVRARSVAPIALLTLALGIGATTAIFSVINAIVLRPFAYASPERVVLVAERYQDQPGAMSVGNFVDIASQSRSFEAMAAINFEAMNLSDGDAAERVLGVRASASLFHVVGTRPALGRVFTANEDVPGNDEVVVLSHGLWARRFGADRAIIGRSVRLNARPYQVIGVMPASFDPTLSGEQLWIPAAFTPAQRAQHDEHYLTALGLLKTNVTRVQALAELGPLMAQLVARYPDVNGGRGILLPEVSSVVVGSLRDRLLVLFGAVFLVLLIACANVANLLLARGAARAKELAIRAAMGAARSRLIRQLLTETFVLAMAAATLGVGLAWALLRVIIAAAPPGFPRLDEARLDLGALLFAAGLGVLASLLAGAVPALRAARRDPQGDLREGGRGMGAIRDRVRQVLVVGEVALALTLLVGAGLLIRSAIAMSRSDPGFDPQGTIIARISLPEAAYRDPRRIVQTLGALQRTLAAQPGVVAAGISSQVPTGPGGGSNGLIGEGKPRIPENLVDTRLRMITPGYLAALRIPLRKGRYFDDRDVAGSLRVTIVSEEAARRLWPGADAIGKRVFCCEGSETDPRVKTVVGVVGDVRSRGLGVGVEPEFYLPIEQVPDVAWDWIRRSVSIVARGQGPDAMVLTGTLRRVMGEIDGTVPLDRINTMTRALAATVAPARFNTILLATLGAIGLILAAIGIYGVVAYFVSMRGHEIGVRLALGATGADVLRLLAWQGMRPIVIGLALGTVCAYWATQALTTSLYGVTPTDAPTFIAVALFLLLVGSVATLIPARRVLKVDPTRALQG